MSHYHLEIIMPPTDDVNAAVREILAPFDENGPDNEEHSPRHSFWDWYVIGGRWSGEKLMQRLGAERIDAFRAGLNARKITVSGLQMGKPTLQPADQQPEVDRLWAEAFPDAPGPCPLFDYYDGNAGDVATLANTDRTLQCEHVIIAGPVYEAGKIAAHLMLQRSIWNGVTHQDTAWDGTVGAALDKWAARLSGYREEWQITRAPGPDWLVVTVDYHS